MRVATPFRSPSRLPGPIDHGHRYDHFEHHGVRVGHRRSGGCGQDAGGHRLPDQFHSGHGLQHHGHRVRCLSQCRDGLHGNRRLLEQRRPGRIAGQLRLHRRCTRGAHTFSLTLETAGTQSITAADTTTSSITGSESGIVVQAAEAKTLAVTGFRPVPRRARAYSVTVTAYDAYNNVATGYTGTVALSSSDGHAGLRGITRLRALTSARHVFSVTLKTAGTQSITATDPRLRVLQGRVGRRCSGGRRQVSGGHRLPDESHCGRPTM